jgi:hypothetical protein
MNPDFGRPRYGRPYLDLLAASPPSAVDRMAGIIDPEAAKRVAAADRLIAASEKMRESMKAIMKQAVNYPSTTPRDWSHIAMIHDECIKDPSYAK